MSTVREMLVELTGVAEFGGEIADDADLSASGVDSGDLVRLVLLIEERTGVEVTAEDMDELSSISDYERLIATRGAAEGAA
ncbi:MULTISPECIES: acyl carrier protein [unclassified Streptomyces]|uniref:acyl carrier protein n=1 Tax=unclassified Streptomyces TaxID=2593676 RepID=UPI0022B6D42F|nr:MULTISPECIES: acyl carrier protein [unclassified Streptomyces]MCZ7417812.1 acyl carrier protein [Streptomyces sp. WMMC897]MCZ7432383.1 acyl carrier protein [Streptomyces sp. WMMC1477]